ncbi:MAG: hypothetical protein J2P13_03295 [Acidobacteria bacterium]|nr:hypothetical protein [Acidobacteriota bacterium]
MGAEPSALNEIEERCDSIEECYELMLAYAGKGSASDEGSQVRYHLERAARAIQDLAQGFRKLVESAGIEPVSKYHAFLAVLERDAADSLAAIELVLAQPAISSQLIDNLNASMHLRALLTDIFLIDGALSERSRADQAAS